MGNKSLAIIAAISVIGLLFLVYLAATFESPQGTSTVAIEQPVPRAPEPVRIPEPPAPVIEEPVEIVELVETEPTPVPTPPAPEPMPELPELNASDDFARTQLGELETGPSLLRLVTSEELVRRFVVFTDNVAQGNLPQLDYPVQRMSEEMQVSTLDQNLYVMEPASYRRFDFLVNTLIAVDVDAALRIYRMLSPLFDEAYAELGYGDRSFESTVIQAIDEVLEARTVEGPFQLVKPSVMYLYAEQDIENMSPVEKQLIRMGPDNAAKLKAKLGEYRRRLAAR